MTEPKFADRIKKPLDPEAIMKDYIELLEKGIKELNQNPLFAKQKPEVVASLTSGIAAMAKDIVSHNHGINFNTPQKGRE